MANKWIVGSDGLGFTPGKVQYIVTTGLEMGAAPAGGGFTVTVSRRHRRLMALILTLGPILGGLV